MFKVELTEQQIAIIGKALGAVPYELAKPVIDEIQRQLDAQQKPNGRDINVEEGRKPAHK